MLLRGPVVMADMPLMLMKPPPAAKTECPTGPLLDILAPFKATEAPWTKRPMEPSIGPLGLGSQHVGASSRFDHLQTIRLPMRATGDYYGDHVIGIYRKVALSSDGTLWRDNPCRLDWSLLSEVAGVTRFLPQAVCYGFC
ncbi:hypothetical protein PoMZ_12894 [Pyricularia oryzae]|uniref:Uncharacterized protein n=1 Tax=Pyricularia oryzae TaxID=318829 RepID=A0A4P7NTU1_PYROR|nr:hypothetical protein PoMZ_12894 [Pyricularia oryzae]